VSVWFGLFFFLLRDPSLTIFICLPGVITAISTIPASLCLFSFYSRLLSLAHSYQLLVSYSRADRLSLICRYISSKLVSNSDSFGSPNPEICNYRGYDAGLHDVQFITTQSRPAGVLQCDVSHAICIAQHVQPRLKLDLEGGTLLQAHKIRDARRCGQSIGLNAHDCGVGYIGGKHMCSYS
jgi:hypothetical protein